MAGTAIGKIDIIARLLTLQFIVSASHAIEVRRIVAE